MKRVGQFFVTLLLTVVAATAFAENIKIGIVDLQKIMQTSSQMKAIQQRLENEFKPRRDKLVAMEDNLKRDMEKFKRDNAIMNAKEKKELERKIIAAQQTFERQGQQYQQELSSAHNEAMEELYNKVRKAIKIVADSQKYDVILQKDAAPFASDKLDITPEVMKNIT